MSEEEKNNFLLILRTSQSLCDITEIIIFVCGKLIYKVILSSNIVNLRMLAPW